MSLLLYNKKKQWQPSNLVLCNKCVREFYPSVVRTCEHPAVNRVYGAAICHYCCSKCAFKVTTEFTGALGCSYKRGEA